MIFKLQHSLLTYGISEENCSCYFGSLWTRLDMTEFLGPLNYWQRNHYFVAWLNDQTEVRSCQAWSPIVPKLIWQPEYFSPQYLFSNPRFCCPYDTSSRAQGSEAVHFLCVCHLSSSPGQSFVWIWKWGFLAWIPSRGKSSIPFHNGIFSRIQ